MVNIKKIDHDEDRVVLEMDSQALSRIVQAYWNYIERDDHKYTTYAREYNTLAIAHELLKFERIDKVRLTLALELLNKCDNMEPF